MSDQDWAAHEIVLSSRKDSNSGDPSPLRIGAYQTHIFMPPYRAAQFYPTLLVLVTYL
jgi:hypothetical protein